VTEVQQGGLEGAEAKTFFSSQQLLRKKALNQIKLGGKGGKEGVRGGG